MPRAKKGNIFNLVFLSTLGVSNMNVGDSEPCSIFCDGPILHAVELSGMFDDSKTFVDMPLKFDPSVVEARFRALNGTVGKGIPVEKLEDFVNENFDKAGSDLESFQPGDWNPNPPFLKRLESQPKLHKWAAEVHKLWLVLGRKPSADVKSNPLQHSLLWTPNPIVVPGGRFRESYYWDTFWILKGLVVSDMLTTATGVVENLLYFCEKFGFVPNGGRSYYLTRSQPPLLSSMVRVVYEALMADDQEGNAGKFLEHAVPILRKEYVFWTTRRRANMEKYAPLCTYNAETKLPRPESYREDYQLAHEHGNRSAKERENLYKNIAAAAESGWDFSSRWFADGKTLGTVNSANIIPVDLNSYMLRFELNMAYFYDQPSFRSNGKGLGKSGVFFDAAVTRYRAMEKWLWNDRRRSWSDFNMSSSGHSDVVAVSDYLPLWAFSVPSLQSSAAFNHSHMLGSLGSLQTSGVVGKAGYLKSTTTGGTGQQWDSPNAWACMQHLMVEGLLSFQAPQAEKETATAHAMGKSIASKWIETNFEAYAKAGYMYEKYDADTRGKGGGGGEYKPQVGFGWTNGVALVFLNESLYATPR